MTSLELILSEIPENYQRVGGYDDSFSPNPFSSPQPPPLPLARPKGGLENKKIYFVDFPSATLREKKSSSWKQNFIFSDFKTPFLII